MNKFLLNKIKKLNPAKVIKYYKIEEHPIKNNYLVFFVDNVVAVLNPIQKKMIYLVSKSIIQEKEDENDLSIYVNANNVAYCDDFNKENNYTFVLNKNKVMLFENTDCFSRNHLFKLIKKTDEQIILRNNGECGTYYVLDLKKREILEQLETKGLMFSRKKLYYKNELIINVNDNTFDLYNEKIKMSLFKMKKNNWFITSSEILYEDKNKIFINFRLRTEKATFRNIYFKYDKLIKKVTVLDSKNIFRFIAVDNKIYKHIDEYYRSMIDNCYFDKLIETSKINIFTEIDLDTLEEKKVDSRESFLIEILLNNKVEGFKVDTDKNCNYKYDNHDTDERIYFDNFEIPVIRPSILYKGQEHYFIESTYIEVYDKKRQGTCNTDKIIFTTDFILVSKEISKNRFKLFKINYSQELLSKIKETFEYRILYTDEKIYSYRETYYRSGYYDILRSEGRSETNNTFSQIFSCYKYNNYYSITMLDLDLKGFPNFVSDYQAVFVTNAKSYLLNKSNKTNISYFLNFSVDGNCERKWRVNMYHFLKNKRNQKYSNIKKVSKMIKNNKVEIKRLSIKNKLSSDFYNGGEI